MFGNAGVELINNQAILTLDQGKFIFGHGKAEKSRFAANRTITLRYFNFGWGQDLKSHTPTMAAPGMFNEVTLRHGYATRDPDALCGVGHNDHTATAKTISSKFYINWLI